MSFALSVSPEVLAALFEKSESSAFAVTLGDVVYRLPAVLFAPDRLRQLKEKVQDGVEGQWTLEIVVQKATAAELALLRESAEQLGAELIAAHRLPLSLSGRSMGKIDMNGRISVPSS